MSPSYSGGSASGLGPGGANYHSFGADRAAAQYQNTNTPFSATNSHIPYTADATAHNPDIAAAKYQADLLFSIFVLVLFAGDVRQDVVVCRHQLAVVRRALVAGVAVDERLARIQ